MKIYALFYKNQCIFLSLIVLKVSSFLLLRCFQFVFILLGSKDCNNAIYAKCIHTLFLTLISSYQTQLNSDTALLTKYPASALKFQKNVSLGLFSACFKFLSNSGSCLYLIKRRECIHFFVNAFFYKGLILKKCQILLILYYQLVSFFFVFIESCKRIQIKNTNTQIYYVVSRGVNYPHKKGLCLLPLPPPYDASTSFLLQVP